MTQMKDSGVKWLGEIPSVWDTISYYNNKINMIIDSTNWTAVGAVATAFSCILTAIMACIAYKSLCQNKKQLDEMRKQRDEDCRARLTAETISWQNMFLLKISNVGKETAYDIHLSIYGDLVKNHFSDAIKQNFESISRRCFCMVSGRELYYLISPVRSDSLCTIEGSTYDGEDINRWLDDNYLSSLFIKGTYKSRGKHTIEESFCIKDFIVGKPLIVKAEEIVALEKISKALYCGTTANPKSMQENLNQLVKDVNKIVSKNG